MNVIDTCEDKNIKFYLEYLKYERRVSDNTVESYGENLKKLTQNINKDILSLTTSDIRMILNNMETSPKTKAHYLSVLNSFYNYMIFNGIIKNNPCSGIKLPKQENKLP